MPIGFVLNSYPAVVHRIGGKVTHRDLLPKAMAGYATLTLLSFAGVASAQQHPADDSLKRARATVPSADLILRDASHQEAGQLTITSGVGTPTAINSLSFSADRRILAAGKDFGRVAIWNVLSENFTWRPRFAAFSDDGAVLYLSFDGRLLLLGTTSNDTCSSTAMYSGAAALSPDPRWFAGAKDHSILAKERTDGVWVWSSNQLLKTCSRAGSFKAEQQW
jgi:WD40 repeat protein